MRSLKGHDYLPLNSTEKRSYQQRAWQQRSLLLISFGICLLMMLLATALGRYQLGRQRNNHDLLAPIGHIDNIFHYDRHFAAHPDAESNKLWMSVVPKGRGFIYNPEVSSEPVGLSAFHQLHCLDAIRRSYYAVQDGTEDLSHHTKPGHVRHCLDYLRQSIICHADATLEPIDPELGGVTGWGVERKCRDFEGLLTWADKWRTHNQTSII